MFFVEMFESVALLFVSSAILRGKRDNNSCSFLINELNSLSYRVEKVLVIEDDEKVITFELSELSKRYDVVIVIEDEVTNQIILKALGGVCSEELKNSSTTKLLNNTLRHPVIYMQRIFILREDCVQEQFLGALKRHLKHYRTPASFTKVVHLQKNGNNINSTLEKLRKSVNIRLEDMQNVVRVVISHENFDRIVECESLLKNDMGDNFIESFEENDVLRSIYKSEETHIRQAIESIEKSLEDYGPENIFLSFNGGKDCTVLLHLVYTVLKIKYPNYRKPVFCLYVKSKQAFSEQDEFIAKCEIFYNLHIKIVTLSIKEALAQVLNSKPQLKACFMGTRRTDPYSKDLKLFQMTDSDWPQIMRVSPILEWQYTDIWDYLLYYKVPYCKLYDMGFTSLGNTSNTIRNPSLSYYDVKLGREIYLPAYKMMNKSNERIGRNVQL